MTETFHHQPIKRFRPFGDRVVVFPHPAPKRGLIINPFRQDHAEEREARLGVVVAMGPGMETKKPALQPDGVWRRRLQMPFEFMGKNVLFYQDSGYKILLAVTIEGVTRELEHIVIRDSEIEALVDSEGFHPHRHRVLVEREATEEISRGGIIIPEVAREPKAAGRVLAVGPGRVQNDGSFRAVDVKVGDRILFNKYGGLGVSIDGKERLLLRDDDIFSVFEE